jgi:chemotaxis protein histidine kinase CheA/ActR/RegA family two-component response regulator
LEEIMASIDRSEFEQAFWREVLSQLVAASSGELSAPQQAMLRKVVVRLALDFGEEAIAHFPCADAQGPLVDVLSELRTAGNLSRVEAAEMAERHAGNLAGALLGPILDFDPDLADYADGLDDNAAEAFDRGEPEQPSGAARQTWTFDPGAGGAGAFDALNAAFPELSSSQDVRGPEDAEPSSEVAPSIGKDLSARSGGRSSSPPDHISPEQTFGFAASEDDANDVLDDMAAGFGPGGGAFSKQRTTQGAVDAFDDLMTDGGDSSPDLLDMGFEPPADDAGEPAMKLDSNGDADFDNLVDTSRDMPAMDAADSPEMASMFSGQGNGSANGDSDADMPSPDDLLGGAPEDFDESLLMGGASPAMPDFGAGAGEAGMDEDFLPAMDPASLDAPIAGMGMDMGMGMGGLESGSGGGMDNSFLPEAGHDDFPPPMGEDEDVPAGMPDGLAGMDLSKIDEFDPSELEKMLVEGGGEANLGLLENAISAAEAVEDDSILTQTAGSLDFGAFLPPAPPDEALISSGKGKAADEEDKGKKPRRKRSEAAQKAAQSLEGLSFEDQIRARMLLISEAVEELAEDGTHKQSVDELIEHFRAISRPITRSGYRTFASLADVLIQTLEFLRSHPVDVPGSLINNLRELVLTLNEIVDGRWSKYRTFYWLINKLNGTQREMEEQAEDIEHERLEMAKFVTSGGGEGFSGDGGDDDEDGEGDPSDTISRERAQLTELQEIFVEEAKEHIDLLSQNLLLAEKHPTDQEIIYTLMRSAHSIKGSANISKFPHLGALAHVMEDVMVAIRDNGLGMTPSIIDLLLSSVDSLSSMLAGVEYNQAYDEKAVERLKGQLQVLGEELQTHPERYKASSAEAMDSQLGQRLGIKVEQKKEEPKSDAQREASTVRVDIEDLNLLRNLAAELVINRTRLSGQLEQLRGVLDGYERERKQILNVQHRLNEAIEELSEKLGELFSSQSGISAYSGNGSSGVGGRITALELSIRSLMRVRESSFLEKEGFASTEFDRFSEFDVIWRDLREGTTHLHDLGDHFEGISNDLDQNISRISNIANDLHEQIMRIRMIPISMVFNRFPRTVRDLSRRLGKKIDLAMRGENTPLDKMIIEEIADPMIHLVRNAIDHGIESPEEREEMEKPETGTVSLEARQEGNQVIIMIRDDGRGINIEAVKNKAVERGILTEAQAESATEAELQNLIFAPGFSTAKQTTDISGRGVGMDVVKTSISKLKGTVTVQSEVGRGTQFLIRLPVTLAISQALLFTASTSRFAIPLSAVDETYMIREDQLMRTLGQEVIKLRADILPVVRLSQVLSLGAPHGEADERPMIVVNTGDRRVGVIVDKLLGREEIVVKNLGTHLKKLRYVSGGTILGDGEVTLILDIFSIVEKAKPIRHADTLMAMGETQSRPAFDATSYRNVIDEARAKVDDVARTHPEMDALNASDMDAESDIPVGAMHGGMGGYAEPHHREEHAGPRSILVVDDSISIRRFVSSILENAGYKTTLANDGVDALEKLKAGRFDLILTDLEMPRMHGYELIAEVKQNIAFRSIPIIILTGRAGEKHSRKGMELGASAFLVKPFNEQELLEEINKATSSGADFAV